MLLPRAPIFTAAFVLGASVDASAAVKIVKIYFDSPGADTGTNYSLNREWVQIHTGGRRAVAIGDWRIRDRSGHVFKLPHIKLKPGQDVRVLPKEPGEFALHRSSQVRD